MPEPEFLTAASAATTPLCTSGQLVAHYVGFQTAAGTFYDKWQLTNFSPVLASRGEPACGGDLVYESPLVLGG